MSANATLALLVALPVTAVLARLAWKRRSRMVAAVFAAAAGLCGWLLLVSAPALVSVAVVLAAAVLVAVMLHRRFRTVGVITRWGDQQRRKKGVASTWDVVRTASSLAMRRKAATVRPSLPPAPYKSVRTLVRPRAWRAWFAAPVTEFSLRLARVGALWVHASAEDVVSIFGGPRVGKTGLLMGLVVDAPGAVVTTSTRTDVMDNTAALFAAAGRPTYVFNPGALGDVPNTLAFDPLIGCENPMTANHRAMDMIPAADDSGERAHWSALARGALAPMLHAAALGGMSMRAVAEWVADPKGTQDEVIELLRRSPGGELIISSHKQFAELNEKTLTSVTATMRPALEWLTIPSAWAATRGEPFNVARLLRARGVVYLLGREDASTAALLAALTGYIAREARRIAALQPKGRLDPPLSLQLDEAARIAPVPLPDWSGDMGGAGVQMTICLQSRADLVDRYGPTGAQKTLNNSGTVVLFGGTKDDQDLTAWSRLAGDRDEVLETTTAGGKVTSRTVRKVPVLSTAQLSNLPAKRAVVFARFMPPAIGRVPMAWNRKDFKAAAKAGGRAAEERLAGLKRDLDLELEAALVDAARGVSPAVPTSANTVGVNGLEMAP